MIHPSVSERISEFNSLWWPRPPVILRYGVAVLSVTAALIIARLLDFYLVTAPVSLFLCAIMFSAWYGGLNPGLFAAALSLLAFIYYFVTPFYSLAIEFSEVPRTIIFALSAIFVGFLSAAQRSATESIRAARDDLSRTVQELRRTNDALQVENAERKRAENALRRSETYLAEAQRLSLTGSFGWNVSSGEIIWSEETFRLYQYDPTTKPTADLIRQRVHPEDAILVKQKMELALEEGTNFDVEHRLLMPDGSIKHVHVVTHALNDESGGIEFVGAVTDVTEAKQSEERIRQIIDTVPALIWTARPNGSLDFISQRWLDYAGIKLEQMEGSELGAHCHPNDCDQFLSRWSAALAEGKPFESETRLRRFDGEYRWFLSRAFPLCDRSGHILGWYGNDTDIHDRKEAEAAIREQASLLDLTHDSIFVRDMNYVITYWNHGAEELYGWKREEALGKVTHDLLQTIFPSSIDEIRAELLRTGRWEGELVHTKSDGTQVEVASRWSLQRDERHLPIAILETNNDITERKRAEEDLRESEQHWRDVFENNPTMYFMVDAEGIVMAVNPFGAEQMGYTVNELVGEPVLDVFYEADRDAVQRNVALCFAQLGRSMSWELRRVRKDGSVFWVRETARAVMRGDDQVILIACEDITERKVAEEKIRQQELELRQLIDLTPQHVAVLGPDRGRLFSDGRLNINQAALDYHGLTFEEWQRTDPRKLFHPDDWEHILNEDQSKFADGIPYETEARLLRNDGQYRWFLFRHNPLRDEQGRVTRWYIAATDIEDRKQAEEKLRNENVALREEIDAASMFEEIVGTSPVLQAVLTDVGKVAPTDTTVLITGETGTGKELIARAIHKRSKRSNRAFVSVNCAAIPQALIASELFGHEKGAFTGALQRRLGRFELAEGGTIFLDEIGELPPETQIALLRVLQENEFERIGGSRPIRADVRVVVATNRDLQAAIRAGSFRSDLFYRLNVFPIEMPPLRARREDIPLLVEYFIDRFARKAGKKIVRINKKTSELLQTYTWPGNIRELQNVIERSVIVCETEDFSVDESWLVQKDAQTTAAGQPLSRMAGTEVRAMIEAALAQTRGRVSGPSGAAARLGIPASTLESKIRALKIRKDRFKSPSSMIV